MKFLNEAELPMFATQKAPVVPKDDNVGPIIPMARWVISGETGMLTKTYMFQDIGAKVMFVKELMQHELETQHSARLNIDEEQVTVEFITKNVNKVTEIDKECARFCDVLFKDIVQMRI